MLIVRNSKFTSNPFGHGGSKRSAQIEQILNSAGITYENDAFLLPKNLTMYQKMRLVWRSFCFITKHFAWKTFPSIDSKIDAIKYFALRIPIILDKYKGKGVCFLWESTVSANYGFPYLMKETGAIVIGIPHNLESVVPSQKDAQTKANAPNWFNLEIERLRLCDAVFTISKEETWLLRLFGIKALYLPYYPPRDAESFYLEIRNKRFGSIDQNKKKQYLLLGSAVNPPTREGMQTIIDMFERKNLSFSLIVAGFGTKALRLGVNPNIHNIGAVFIDQLKDVLTETDAVICYQPPTSGALTRIPEMLIAGVPVFANFDSVRDYHHVEDVFLYKSFDELFNQLSAFQPHLAAMPVHLWDSEDRFVKTVIKLANIDQ